MSKAVYNGVVVAAGIVVAACAARFLMSRALDREHA
jgi:hypothetical protein